MINSPKSGYATRIIKDLLAIAMQYKTAMEIFGHEKNIHPLGASFAFTFNPHRLVNARLFRDPIGASGFTPNSHRPTRAFNDSWDGCHCHWISTFLCLSQATKILEIFGCRTSRSAGRFIKNLDSMTNMRHTLQYHIWLVGGFNHLEKY